MKYDSIRPLILLCEKIGKCPEGEINCRVVKSCDEDFDIDEEFIVFTCPALYHKVKHRLGDYRLLDLRVLRAFRNPDIVLHSLLHAESVSVEREIETVNVGNRILYVGENLELIEELSPHCELIVVTTDEDTIKKLYPYDIRAIRGVVEEIRGELGNFEVTLNGYDVISDKKVGKLKVDQIIYPAFNGKIKEGIYTDEYYGGFKVLSNIYGYIRVIPVKINTDFCGHSKSGLSGCEFCLTCPSIGSKDGNIIIDINSCIGCGFCSSICPTSAIKNCLIPSDILIKKIDRVVDNTSTDTVAFVCEKALSHLTDFRNLPDIAPILVPCINSVSEIHYLYAALKGFNVVAIPCECNNLKKDCFDIANQTLNAFGFNCIEITRWDKLEETVKQLRKSKKPEMDFNLKGKNKREIWMSMVESLLMHYDVKEREFKSNYFGKLKLNESLCTMCNSCINFCPTNAIRKENNRILFTHSLCIACKLCENACPENAIEVVKILDFGDLHERTLLEEEMIKCPRCGKEHISKRAYEKLKHLTGMEKALLFCKDCRPVVIFESLYNEVLADIKKGKSGD